MGQFHSADVSKKANHSRGFLTPTCLWAYRNLRGGHEPFLKSFEAPEMSFMQILLLRHVDPNASVPFLIENFQQKTDTPEELKDLSRLCISTILNNGITPDLLRSLQTRYPKTGAVAELETYNPLSGYFRKDSYQLWS